MKPTKQTKLHNPPEQNGNCFAACVASIFEVDINTLPKFEDEPGNTWWQMICDYATSRGYAAKCVAINDGDGNQIRLKPTRLIDHVASELPKGYSIITGKSPRGDWDHSMVALDGYPVFDPAWTPGDLEDYRDWIFFEKNET